MHALYNSTKFDTVPELEFTDGDGTVPETGLRMLERWRGKQEKEIYHYPIPGLHHGGSPQNKQVLRMFLEVLSR